jgi:hypothetical protein
MPLGPAEAPCVRRRAPRRKGPLEESKRPKEARMALAPAGVLGAFRGGKGHRSG